MWYLQRENAILFCRWVAYGGSCKCYQHLTVSLALRLRRRASSTGALVTPHGASGRERQPRHAPSSGPAGHRRGQDPESPAEKVAVLIENIRTTKLHDRRRQQVTRVQVESIRHERKAQTPGGGRKVR
jgi:hypothetical protein